MTSESDQKILLAKLIAAYRYQFALGITEADNTYAVRIETQIKAACSRAGLDIGSAAVSKADRFTVTTDFMRLLCAADMFFVKFPRHNLSPLKVGTLTMAYKDMSQVNNTLYLESLTGLEWTVLYFYTFEKGLIAELKKIDAGGWRNEIFYFPYQSAMSLLEGKCTYYSNTANPKFQNVVQLVGMMKSSSRSFNAFYLETPTPSQVGQAVIYMMASSGESSSSDDTVGQKAHKFFKDIGNQAQSYTDIARRCLNAAKNEARARPVIRTGSFAEWIKWADVERICEVLLAQFKRTSQKNMMQI